MQSRFWMDRLSSCGVRRTTCAPGSAEQSIGTNSGIILADGHRAGPRTTTHFPLPAYAGKPRAIKPLQTRPLLAQKLKKQTPCLCLGFTTHSKNVAATYDRLDPVSCVGKIRHCLLSSFLRLKIDAAAMRQHWRKRVVMAARVLPADAGRINIGYEWSLTNA
jgi:hypothetical protein